MIINTCIRKNIDGYKNRYIYTNGYYELRIEDINNHVFFELYIPWDNGKIWEEKDAYIYNMFIDSHYYYKEEPKYREDINKTIHFKQIKIDRHAEELSMTIDDLDRELRGLEIVKKSAIEFNNFIKAWSPI